MSKLILTILKEFVARIYRGTYRRGKHVRAVMVCVALSAISQTLVLDRFAMTNSIIVNEEKLILIGSTYLTKTSSTS